MARMLQALSETWGVQLRYTPFVQFGPEHSSPGLARYKYQARNPRMVVVDEVSDQQKCQPKAPNPRIA